MHGNYNQPNESRAFSITVHTLSEKLVILIFHITDLLLHLEKNILTPAKITAVG